MGREVVHLGSVTVSFRNVSPLIEGGASVFTAKCCSFWLNCDIFNPLMYAHLQTWPSPIVSTLLTPVFNLDAVLYTLNMPVM